MRIYFLIFLICLVSGCSSIKKIDKTKTLAIFKEVITGDFDNSKQVDDEVANGTQIHPYAKHVNRIANDKIEGLPKTKKEDNFWLIEESYYKYPTKPLEIKPYLFNFQQGENETILLRVYQFPSEVKKEDITNSNIHLRFKYIELTPSPTFKGATYIYNKKEGTFFTNSPNDLGNGIKFTLIETLSKNKLVVMELLEKNGQRVTTYNTPIIYDRK